MMARRLCPGRSNVLGGKGVFGLEWGPAGDTGEAGLSASDQHRQSWEGPETRDVGVTRACGSAA